MQINYAARLEKLLEQAGVDVVALVPGANMLYFTGLDFHLSERPILAFISKAGLAFIIPELEAAKVTQRDDLDATLLSWNDATGYQDAFRQAVATLQLDQHTLGVDGQTMRVFEWLALAHAGVDISTAVDAGHTLLHIRAIKETREVDFMREAVAITEKALSRIMEWVEVGMTERQITQKLSEQLTQLGSEGHAFEPIVLVGKNSALPHGVPGDAVLGANDFLLIDFGGKKHGYPADITRTFCLGTPTNEMKAIYEAVKAANQAARDFAKPGVTCHEVDKVARDVIEAAGFGKLFTHRLGHGLGVSVHESPNIAPNDDTVLDVGMVFTIEPGIYNEALGGVRIEDDVVVTATGVESLTSYPRDL